MSKALILNKTFKTPFGTFLYQGEPLASIMLRIFDRMSAQGNYDIYVAGECVGLTKSDVDEILLKDEFKGQIQNIKNSRKFQEAEKTSETIMDLREKIEASDGKVDPAVLSNVRQHTEFLLERLGKNAGYATRQENLNVTIELSPERREQLAKIIDIEN